MPYIAAMW